jgi:hypothetical protein
LRFFFQQQGVKYIITVKTGTLSPKEFEGNLGINIVARNFDTGFIKLDENILKSSPQRSKPKDNDENEPTGLFGAGQTNVFEFEDQDIRTVRNLQFSFQIVLNNNNNNKSNHTMSSVWKRYRR